MIKIVKTTTVKSIKDKNTFKDCLSKVGLMLEKVFEGHTQTTILSYDQNNARKYYMQYSRLLIAMKSAKTIFS